MRLTTSLFTASFLSVVVAGWMQLDASSPDDGPSRRPALREFAIDGAPARISIDRQRLQAGGEVRATLALTEAQNGFTDVRVALLEQEGPPMERSMPPTRAISAQLIHMGKEPVELAFKLDGAAAQDAADPLTVAGQVTQYTIQVTSPDPNGSGGAAIPVFAYRPEAYQMTIEEPARAEVGEPVELVVHVKNVADKPLKGISISASSTFSSVDDYPRVEGLEPGEETTVTLHGTRFETAEEQPMQVQVFGWAEYGGSSAAYVKLDRETGAITERASEPLADGGMMAYGY